MKNNFSNLIKLLEKARGKRILVAGDLMLDCFIKGEIKRTSPEAPVPIVSVEEEMFMPGGAANVANNLAALGIKAYLAGVIGKDAAGDRLLNLLKRAKINTEFLWRDFSRPTTQKTRIVARNRHIVRIDSENAIPLKKIFENRTIKCLKKIKNKIDAVIISDYNKGFLTENLAKAIFKIFKGKPIIVDTKPSHILWFRNATAITPNLKEALLMAKPFIKSASPRAAGKVLVDKINANILITMGKAGMMLFRRDKADVFSVPACAGRVQDISGAGDTATALFSASLSVGINLEEAVVIANKAAGLVVEKFGVATVSLREIKESLR